jgi:hypothetical protein
MRKRPYYIKVLLRAEGVRAADDLVKELNEQGYTPHVYPGISPKCKANHFQPGFGGEIDDYCPQCKGWVNAP